ncbi:MAG: radical SAM protein [Phenylobacterium sp.]|nr:radical SAM protein [Phenylobacterium sp.]
MRAARAAVGVAKATPLNQGSLRVLIVDLNNFSTFPTLAVGLLVASLRNTGFEVKLVSPLAHDVPATERERPETWLDHVARRAFLSTWAPLRLSRDLTRRAYHLATSWPHPGVIKAAREALRDKPDILLLSAYLQHQPTAFEIGKLAKAAGVPLLIGGPMFNIEETNAAWRGIPGLSALVGAEVDITLPAIVRAVVAGDDLMQFDGVVLPDGQRSRAAPPLRPLDDAPLPDFSDFPWDRYRVRIIPMMTGRGCQWARCTFCSDVISVNGRSYRSRSLESVLHEMREQSRRHGARNFLFLDLKLNSNPSLFRGITENIQRQVPGAQWIGTVHVDRRKDNGLSRGELRAAAGAGMRRVSFGLESGSQRVLDSMDKGSDVERNSEFIRHAFEAGMSVRATLFWGFPGETAKDLDQTADFLERHGQYLDRIRYNQFVIQTGTPVELAIRQTPENFPDIRVSYDDDRYARVRYVNTAAEDRLYRNAKNRVQKAIFEINRRQIRSSAREFDGLM